MTAFRICCSSSPRWSPLAGCDRPAEDSWLGYVEAEYTYVAPLEAGRIVALEVDRGDQVQAGQPLFTLESDAEQAARDQAAAELAQAESDLTDLQKGDRPEDLAIIQAQLDKAQASLALSVPRLQRREKMVKGSIIGEEELDEAKSQILADRGNIAEYEARLTEGRLPARIDKIVAAEKLVEARKAALADAEWRLSRRQEKAPAAGRIEDVFFRAGETASAGQGVVSLLTPDKLKLRFFVPEPELDGHRGRAEGRRRLRRLPAEPDRHRQLHRARGGIHAARHLQPDPAREAGVPGRSEARRSQPAVASRACRST